MMNQQQTAQAAIAFLNRAALKGEEVPTFIEVQKFLAGFYEGKLTAVERAVESVAEPDPEYPEEIARTYKVMDRAKAMVAE